MEIYVSVRACLCWRFHCARRTKLVEMFLVILCSYFLNWPQSHKIVFHSLNKYKKNTETIIKWIRRNNIHTTVVLNSDRLVGRTFVDIGVDTGCKELARRLGGFVLGGGWGLAVSHDGRAADVQPNGLLILSMCGLIAVFVCINLRTFFGANDIWLFSWTYSILFITKHVSLHFINDWHLLFFFSKKCYTMPNTATFFSSYVSIRMNVKTMNICIPSVWVTQIFRYDRFFSDQQHKSTQTRKKNKKKNKIKKNRKKIMLMEWIIGLFSKRKPQNEFNQNTKLKLIINQIQWCTSLFFCCWCCCAFVFVFLLLAAFDGKQLFLLASETDYMIIFSISNILYELFWKNFALAIETSKNVFVIVITWTDCFFLIQ